MLLRRWGGYLFAVLLYASETRATEKADEQRLLAFEIRCYRLIMTVWWQDHWTSGEEIEELYNETWHDINRHNPQEVPLFGVRNFCPVPRLRLPRLFFPRDTFPAFVNSFSSPRRAACNRIRPRNNGIRIANDLYGTGDFSWQWRWPGCCCRYNTRPQSYCDSIIDNCGAGSKSPRSHWRSKDVLCGVHSLFSSKVDNLF